MSSRRVSMPSSLFKTIEEDPKDQCSGVIRRKINKGSDGRPGPSLAGGLWVLYPLLEFTGPTYFWEMRDIRSRHSFYFLAGLQIILTWLSLKHWWKWDKHLWNIVQHFPNFFSFPMIKGVNKTSFHVTGKIIFWAKSSCIFIVFHHLEYGENYIKHRSLKIWVKHLQNKKLNILFWQKAFPRFFLITPWFQISNVATEERDRLRLGGIVLFLERPLYSKCLSS